MLNFEFYAPTRIYFGRGEEKRIGEIVKNYGFHKVLIHYGGGSVKRTGLLQTVEASLQAAGIDYVELGGVQANPVLSLAQKGIDLCLKENVDLILAVGGGSVIDSSKCIADGVGDPEHQPWKFFLKEAVPQKALPVATILTLSASGSEMSASCVITNEDGGLKRGFNSDTHRPLFSILNPELTFTVNPFQTGCGTVDIMMHTMERYFTKTKDVDLTDRIAEGLLKSVIEAGKVVAKDPCDYEARATLMWAGSLSHNDLTGAGREVFMSIHQMEHELSGMDDTVAHGAGLSALFGSWARYVCKYNVERFAQFAVRVWNCEMDFENPEATALAGIEAMENYYRSIGMPTTLRELGFVPDDACIEEMAEKCTFFGSRTLNDFIPLDREDIAAIYRAARE